MLRMLASRTVRRGKTGQRAGWQREALVFDRGTKRLAWPVLCDRANWRADSTRMEESADSLIETNKRRDCRNGSFSTRQRSSRSFLRGKWRRRRWTGKAGSDEHDEGRREGTNEAKARHCEALGIRFASRENEHHDDDDEAVIFKSTRRRYPC